MPPPKVLIVMADYGHDPSEAAVPWQAFEAAGFEVTFATETGNSPTCDKKMLEGWTGKLLGAQCEAKNAYAAMLESPSLKSPAAWSSDSLDFENYHLLFFPGGHEKSVRQVLDAPAVRRRLARYWRGGVRKDAGAAKAVCAVCHGVLVLAETRVGDAEESDEVRAEATKEGTDGAKSILHDVHTTTLPNSFESGIWWATRALLGDYYKTYGAGSLNCEDQVKQKLDNPAEQFKGSSMPGPFVVEDPQYNYISARYPADAQLLADKVVALVKSFNI